MDVPRRHKGRPVRMLRWLLGLRPKPPRARRSGAEAGAAKPREAPLHRGRATGSKAMRGPMRAACARTMRTAMSRATMAGSGRWRTAWAATKAANGPRAGSSSELGRIDLALGFEETCEEARRRRSRANRQILAEGKKRGKSMGSTLVMLVIEGTHYARALGRGQPRLSDARRQARPAEPRPYPGAGDGRRAG